MRLGAAGDGSGFARVLSINPSTTDEPPRTPGAGLEAGAAVLLPVFALRAASLAGVRAAAAGGNMSGFLARLAAHAPLRAVRADCCLFAGAPAPRAFAGAFLQHLACAAGNPAASLGAAAARVAGINPSTSPISDADAEHKPAPPGGPGGPGFVRRELIEFARLHAGLVGSGGGQARARLLPACFADASLWRQGTRRGHQAYTVSSAAWGARPPTQHELPASYHGIRTFADFQITAAAGTMLGGGLHTAVSHSRIHPALDGY